MESIVLDDYEKNRISVIVPIYKVEKYIKKCVGSILNQSYKNLEIILVDDGSPDNCPKICDELAEKDKRIVVVHKKNGGLSSARNAGIEVATGEYIAFIDSDDYIHNNMFEVMLKLIKDNNADICICNYEYVDENGNLFPTSFSSPLKDEVIDQKQIFKKLTEPNEWYYITAWNKLYKKDILDNNVFPVGKIHEDAFSIHHILDKCNRIVCTSKKYYYYVQRDGSIMSQRSIKSILDSTEAMLDRYHYYCSIGRKDGGFFIGVAYSFLIMSFTRFTKLDKTQNKRRNKYFFEVFDILLKKLDVRAVKLLLFWVYCKLPGKNIIKPIVKKLRSIKSKYHVLKSNLAYIIKLVFSGRKIILFQTPLHGNIGDQAITIAEYRLLSEKFPNTSVIEVPGGEIQSRLWNRLTFKICVRKSDLVLVHGGGFLGTLWMNEEKQIQKLLSNMYNRKIIIMPQTIYYDKDETGKKELRVDTKIYKKCHDLKVFLREKISDDFFNNNFNSVKHILVPDMVLWLDGYSRKETNKSQILLCLRKDAEKTQDVDIYIKQELSYLSEDICFTDTVVNHMISPAKREAEVTKKIDEFSKARLIITDRLHGMVLAAIAETPCIVILSKSHKVKGVYEWIKELEYIELVEDVSQIREAAQRVLCVDKPHYDNSDVKNAFEPLIKAIQEWSNTK